MRIPLNTSSRDIYGIARDILVNKTRFMDLKQGNVTGESYRFKYSKNKPVFAIKNLYTMSGSDYSKPSLENVKAGIDYDNYYGLYATDKPYDENDIDKGTNVYTQTFFNDKADGKEKILDMQKELTKEERANIADGLQKHIENKLGYLLEPALNIEEGTAWANDVSKHKKAKKLMDKLNEIRNGDFTSGGSIYHSIRNILSDFKPEAQKHNSNYTHKMARDFLLSIGYDGIIDDWRGKRRQIVSFRDDNITVDRHQKAVDYGKLEDVNELTEEEKAIKEKAIANGTFMKAPNGKQSNLSEKEWLTVRTENFKKWFGDWEKSYIRNYLETVETKTITVGIFKKDLEKTVPESALKYFDGSKIYNTIIGKVEIDERSAKDTLGHGYSKKKLDILTSLQSDFKNAIYLKSLNDFAGNNIINYYFCYPVIYNNKRELVFCRTRHDNNKNRLYVHEVFIEEDIKKGKTLQAVASANKVELRGGIALYRSILEDIYNVNPKEISKVVDENGEPLVVYHGTEYGGHHTFNAEEYAKSEPVTWFVDKKDVAFEYARNYETETFNEEEGSQIYSCFLNIKNPIVLEANEKDYLEMENKIYEATNDNEHDGVIVHNIKDNRWNDGVIKGAYTGTSNTYAVKNSNQIKSATDNIGTFDEDNDDIRFSVVQDEKLLDELEKGETVTIGDEVDATGFDEYLEERAKEEGITSKEDIN